MPRDDSADAAAAAPAPTADVELLVPGMRCGGCIAGVERRLSAVEGVLSARVNLTAKRAHATIDPARTSAEALVAALSPAAVTEIGKVPGLGRPE